MRKFYELSQDADQDIDEIFEYTKAVYGFSQAIQYLPEIEQVITKLLGNPGLGRNRDEIKRGLRSIPKGDHIIFYSQSTDRIRVVRILHGKRDMPQRF